jgi:hypothetical protein
MKTKTNKLGITEQNFRKLQQLTVEHVDEETRTVTLSATSEFAVKRYDWGNREYYMEILSHDPADVDLSRMNDGGPVLDRHFGDQIGVVEEMTIKDKRSYVKIRFSENPRADEIYKDVIAKIRRNVSAGYNLTGITKTEDPENGEGLKKVYFRWMPYEVSFEPVPADPTVGVGRSKENTQIELDLPQVETRKEREHNTTIIIQY